MKPPDEIAAEIVIDPGPLNKEYRVLIADAIRGARREGAEAALALVAERLRDAGDDVGFRVVCNTENPCAEPKESDHASRS